MRLIEAIIAIALFSLTAAVCAPLLNVSMRAHRESAERIARASIIRDAIAAFENACGNETIPAAPEGCAVRTFTDERGRRIAVLEFEISGTAFELFSEVSHDGANP